jgi:hypothetical protein
VEHILETADIEDPNILGAIIENLVATETWFSGSVRLWCYPLSASHSITPDYRGFGYRYWLEYARPESGFFSRRSD